MNPTAKLLLLAADFLVIALYSALNHPTASVANLGTPLDQALPVVSILVVPYLIFLPFYWAALVYSYVKGSRFVAFSVAHLAIFLAGSLVFMIYQTTVIRPAILSQDLFSPALNLLYEIDPPYNAFPSLHVAAAVLTAIYSLTIRGRFTTPVLIFMAIVIPSTVLLKQHYLIDLVGGLVLGGLVGWASFKWVKN